MGRSLYHIGEFISLFPIKRFKDLTQVREMHYFLFGQVKKKSSFDFKIIFQIKIMK